MPGKLVLVTGPSGVGKQTLIDYALAQIPTCERSISATTRPPRPHEEDGREYYFLSRPDFEQRIKDGGFAEHAEYAGNLYGTPYTSIVSKLASGLNVLIELEVQGAIQMMKKMPACISIFVMPPAPELETLRARLMARAERTGETTDIEARLLISAREMEQRMLFSHRIINDNLERAQTGFVAYLTQKFRASAA